MSIRHLCGSAITLSFILASAMAQEGDRKAQALVEQARKTLVSQASDRVATAEGMLREALAVPDQSPASKVDVATNMALFLMGAQAPADAIRPFAEQARSILAQSRTAVDPARQALVTDILAAIARPDESDTRQRQSTEIRSGLVAALIAKEGMLPPTAGEPRRIGGEVTPPKPVIRPEPEYTPEARMARRQGAVLMSVVIDVDGRVRGIRLARSLGFGLDEAALLALTKWQFEPSMANGQPVAVNATVEMNFRLL